MSEQDNVLTQMTSPGSEKGPLGCYTLLLLISTPYALIILSAALRILPVTAPFVLLAVAWGCGMVLLLLLLALWLRRWWAGLFGSLLLMGLWIWLVTSTPAPVAIAALLTLAFAVLVLFLGAYLVAGYVIPEEKVHRWTIFKCLCGYTVGEHYPYYVIVRERYEDDKIEKRCPGDAFSQFATGTGLVITPCDHAVAISDGVKFKGVKGPGVVFTGFGDQPVRTLDLRPQLRAFTVRGLTQDGIEVQVPAAVAFRIETGGREPRLGEPLPYRRSAAFRAVHAQKIEHEGHGQVPERTKQRSWDELPPLMAERILQDILAGYRFDDLYGPYEVGESPPRTVIADTFRDRLKGELRALGIQLVGGGIGNLLPVRDEVLEERVRSWQADWIRQTMLKQAEGHAEWLRQIEQARAEARADLILALGERLAELDRPDARIRPEQVLHQLLEIMEGMLRRPSFQRYVPRDTIVDVGRVREALGGRGGEGGGDVA